MDHSVVQWFFSYQLVHDLSAILVRKKLEMHNPFEGLGIKKERTVLSL